MSDIRTFKTAVIDASLGADNTIIAASSTRPIIVWKLWFVTAAAVNLIFKAGSTALSGTEVFGGNGSIFFAYDGSPYFYCPPNTAFIINLSGAVNIAGSVYYTLG